MDGSGNARDDARRATLDAIRDLRATGVDAALAQKLDEVERALGSGVEADESPGVKPRQFGAFAGRFSVGPEFFEPLSEQELRAWSEI